MAACQERVVLQNSPQGLPYHCTTYRDIASDIATNRLRHSSSSDNASHSTTSTGRPLQLRRWVCELAGRLVCGEKGLVLPSSWKGLPRQRWWWLRNYIEAIRLPSWIRQLAGRMVSRQESLVLPQRGQGVPHTGWWMCLSGPASRVFFHLRVGWSESLALDSARLIALVHALCMHHLPV